MSAVLAVGLAFITFLTVDQAHWWRLKPDYAFGWLTPIFAVYVVFERRSVLAAYLHPPAPSALPGWLRLVFRLAAGSALAAGTVIFLLGAMYRAGSGPTQPGSLALAIGFAAILIAMVYFNAADGRLGAEPAASLPDAIGRDARIRATLLFVFPALIWMISAPLVTAVENGASLFLLHKVVTVVFAVFSLLGVPLLQQGNVLVLPHGQVGVADACSGIRSLTGCLFAGSFLAAVSLDRWWKKILLVAASLVLAFLTNLLRSLFLTAWAYAYGSDAIEGALHDGTGFAILGFTCAGLFGLLALFRRRTSRAVLQAA